MLLLGSCLFSHQGHAVIFDLFECNDATMTCEFGTTASLSLPINPVTNESTVEFFFPDMQHVLREFDPDLEVAHVFWVNTSAAMWTDVSINDRPWKVIDVSGSVVGPALARSDCTPHLFPGELCVVAIDELIEPTKSGVFMHGLQPTFDFECTQTNACGDAVIMLLGLGLVGFITYARRRLRRLNVALGLKPRRKKSTD